MKAAKSELQSTFTGKHANACGYCGFGSKFVINVYILCHIYVNMRQGFLFILFYCQSEVRVHLICKNKESSNATQRFL